MRYLLVQSDRRETTAVILNTIHSIYAGLEHRKRNSKKHNKQTKQSSRKPNTEEGGVGGQAD